MKYTMVLDKDDTIYWLDFNDGVITLKLDNCTFDQGFNFNESNILDLIDAALYIDSITIVEDDHVEMVPRSFFNIDSTLSSLEDLLSNLKFNILPVEEPNDFNI